LQNNAFVAGGVTCVYLIMQLGARFGIHLTLEQWYRQYGPIYKFFLGRAPVVVVTGTHNSKAQQICTAQYVLQQS